MKTLTRLLLILTMVFSLSLVTVHSAAGDPTADGEVAGGDVPGAGEDPGAPPVVVPGLSTPRVILAGFTTNPTQVQAGEDFQVTFTLHNTSKRTRVQNMLITLTSADAAFLPANGSSSIYLPRIGADQIESGTMNFHSLPSLDAKPYQLTLSIEYEDNQANAYSAQETVSVMVAQDARVEASTPQLMPGELSAGQDASLTFSIFNQGKSKLYNAKAVVADSDLLVAQEVFVGTIDPGTSGAVDMTVQAQGEGSGEVMITVSYENADGEVSTFDKPIAVAVMDPMIEEEPGMWEEPLPEDGVGFPWGGLLAVVVLLAVVLVIVVLVRSRRRKRAEAEDMDLLAAMGDPLIGPDPR